MHATWRSVRRCRWSCSSSAPIADSECCRPRAECPARSSCPFWFSLPQWSVKKTIYWCCPFISEYIFTRIYLDRNKLEIGQLAHRNDQRRLFGVPSNGQRRRKLIRSPAVGQDVPFEDGRLYVYRSVHVFELLLHLDRAAHLRGGDLQALASRPIASADPRQRFAHIF